MATYPSIDTDGVLRVTVAANGTPQPDLAVVSATVRRAFNRMPWAEIVIRDGDMPTGTFACGDTADFAPGSVVTISAGFGNDEAQIFSGVVVRHGVRIEGQNDSRLVIECRDLAVKMTIGRHNANFVNSTDSDILGTLIAAHGLSANVGATTGTYGEMVQFYSSDWDFLLARAEFNGMLVDVEDGTVNVQPPQASGQPVFGVTWGIDLYEFDADIDARLQYQSVQATAWDPATQAIVQGDAATPAPLNAQGNLDSATLAQVIGLPVWQLQTATTQPPQTLTSWAKGVQTRAELARIRGHLRCMGTALAKPGVLVQVSGVGARFSGAVYVTAVEHALVGGFWHTDVEFGLEPGWQPAQADVQAPPAAGLLPGIGGLQIGVVLKLDGDPLNAQRIQISLPVTQAQTQGVWARLIQGYASNGFGAFFLPEVGDEVIVGYLNDDPCHPVVLGAVYSSNHMPPYAIEATNDIKAIVTRAKHVIEFDEKNKIVTITTPGQNKVVLDDTSQSILVQDQHSNSVKLSQAGIACDSPYDITLSAQGSIRMSADVSIEMTAQVDVKAAGLNVQCEAQVGFTGKGGATAELSAAGQTTVQGALVMIN
ncbi:type VI secretion system tip protein VgrG [Cupriavidus campinensis]